MAASNDIFYCGLAWDVYTSAVESQIAKDFIAMTAANINCTIIAVTPNNDADRLLRGFGIRRVPLLSLATFFIAYNTQSPELASVPEHVRIVIQRNLFREKLENTIDFSPKIGYYIPPQGRVSYQTLNVHKPAPNWNKNTILDPAILRLWG